ncbi:hypothetical protein L1887_57194 [Cichorium endivia]|nr:hypothetical protein L1887_57194 [Cichorium endivia]
MEQFERDYGDTANHKAKVSKKKRPSPRQRQRAASSSQRPQRKLFDNISLPASSSALPSTRSTRLQPACHHPLPSPPSPSTTTTAITAPSDEDADSDQSSDDDDDGDSTSSAAEAAAAPSKPKGAKSEADAAVDRVLGRYLKAKVDTASDDDVDPEEDYRKRLDAQMTEWKKDYYKQKLEFDYSNDEAMSKLAFRYIEGLQWVLHYYYDGVASWGWFLRLPLRSQDLRPQERRPDEVRIRARQALPTLRPAHGRPSRPQQPAHPHRFPRPHDRPQLAHHRLLPVQL